VICDLRFVIWGACDLVGRHAHIRRQSRKFEIRDRESQFIDPKSQITNRKSQMKITRLHEISLAPIGDYIAAVFM
jgi:hypothetical protein